MTEYESKTYDLMSEALKDISRVLRLNNYGSLPDDVTLAKINERMIKLGDNFRKEIKKADELECEEE